MARNVKASLRRRHRVIAFIGATIVLATFIVKDEKRDRIKEELAAINAAEGVFLIRGENRDVPVRLIKLDYAMRKKSAGVVVGRQQTSLERKQFDLLLIIEASNQWLQTVLADIDNIDRLTQPLGALPSDLQKKFDDVKNEATELKGLLSPKEDIWDDEKAAEAATTNIDDKSTTPNGAPVDGVHSPRITVFSKRSRRSSPPKIVVRKRRLPAWFAANQALLPCSSANS